ncbi:MAG: lipopolysaccharide biosynthesis protein [Actinobacteria bacterium]|nr:MAG: lipopolysaccharide biosynthesis protein [Actinomycetota bacterium]
MNKNIYNQTVTGINWNLRRVIVLTILKFIASVVLARLILPADFGIIVIATILTGFTGLFSTIGLESALIQKKLLNESHIRISFTLSIIFGILVYITIFFLAPFIAIFFKEPRLVLILRIISVIIPIHGIATIGTGMLIREMKFKSIFLIDITSYFIGYMLIGIILALLGFKVWSLVIGIVSNQFINLLLVLFIVKIHKKFLIKIKESKELLVFGSGISLITIFTFFTNNIDNIVIGRFLSSDQVGIYNRAFNLMKLPFTNISEPISKVLFPFYSDLQYDIKNIEKAFMRSINAVALISFPILISMALLSKYIILGLYGTNWEGAIKVFQILCIAGILKVIYNLIGPVARATGNVFAEVWRQFIFVVILVGGAVIGTRYGIEGVGIAVLLASIWLYLSMASISIKILKSSWKNYFLSQLYGFYISIILFVLILVMVFAVEKFLPWVSIIYKLFIFIFIIIIAYISCILFLPKKVKGDIPGWIIDNYSSYLPSLIKKFLKKYFNRK